MNKVCCDVCGKGMNRSARFDPIKNEGFCIIEHGFLWDICDSCRVDLARWSKLKKDGLTLVPERRPATWVDWTDDRSDYVYCSECEYGTEGEVKKGEETPFCPHCGAEMV